MIQKHFLPVVSVNNMDAMLFQSSNLRIVFVRAYFVIDVTSLHQLRAT